VKPNELVGTSSKVFVFSIFLFFSQNDDHPQEYLAKFKYRLSMKVKEIARVLYIFGYMLEPNREI
jgi:hypothetical protein